MKHKILFTVFLLAISFSVLSYSQQNDSGINKSSIITKSSNDSGVFIKYVDVYLPELKLLRTFETLEVSVRIFFNEVNGYYFMLRNFNTDDVILMIEYSKLVEINNALLLLSANLDNDIATQPDYLENKYLVDDIAVGYFVRKGYTVNSRTCGWFIDSPSGTRIFFNQTNPNKISFLEMLNMIQSKIEELQKIYDK